MLNYRISIYADCPDILFEKGIEYSDIVLSFSNTVNSFLKEMNGYFEKKGVRWDFTDDDDYKDSSYILEYSLSFDVDLSEKSKVQNIIAPFILDNEKKVLYLGDGYDGPVIYKMKKNDDLDDLDIRIRITGNNIFTFAVATFEGPDFCDEFPEDEIEKAKLYFKDTKSAIDKQHFDLRDRFKNLGYGFSWDSYNLDDESKLYLKRKFVILLTDDNAGTIYDLFNDFTFDDSKIAKEKSPFMYGWSYYYVTEAGMSIEFHVDKITRFYRLGFDPIKEYAKEIKKAEYNKKIEKEEQLKFMTGIGVKKENNMDKFYEDAVKSAGNDIVNAPPHYVKGGIECFNVILESQGLESAKSFCIGNAMKYIFRHKEKNGFEDILKAKWYIDKYIEISKGDKK